ncbi:zinc-ribbon domain-containing protein [Bacillus sp. T33-2]|uniref:zinc-ribbon domain-containing protein n=1 Tax=Bacillus sp. T33-2 TaxID=2054168 RepID=UPI00115BF27F|nr:zinc-ribbon domain-containing protein [Bacillus sp. T33-2]
MTVIFSYRLSWAYRGGINRTILEDKIEISMRGISTERYEKLGYVIPKKINKLGKEVIDFSKNILIKVKDLSEGSDIRVTKVCDECGKKIVNQRYDSIIRNRKNGDGIDRCKECGVKKLKEINRTKLPSYGESLEFYCKNNSIEHLLNDFTKNNSISPDKIFKGSGKKYLFKCPKCNFLKKTEARIITRQQFSCLKCGDGISYPEKIMVNMLIQSGIDFISHITFNWSYSKLYDFYIPSLNLIIETHGSQHYDGGFESFGGRDVLEEQENDKLKEKLARENGIENYIIIDCRKSELEWIKKSIVNSELKSLIDLSNIDWLKCHEYACNTLVKFACELWNEGKTTGEIANELKSNRNTIAKYLKQGTQIGWCDYSAKEGLRRSKINADKKKRKPVIQFTLDGKYVKEWDSIVEVETELEIHNSKITEVCRGKRNKTGGYKWMYKEEFIKEDTSAIQAFMGT